MSDKHSHIDPAALILMGVSGSGKSTVAEQLAARLNWAYEDADAFHPAANVAKMHAGTALTDEDRWPWLQTIADEIDRRRANGDHLVLACSALKRVYRDILVHGRADVRVVFLKGDHDLIARRLTSRKGHFMSPELLESQFNTLEEPAADERAIVVEINASIDHIVDRIVSKLHLEDHRPLHRNRS